MCPLVSSESEAVATAQRILVAKRKFDERQAIDEPMDIARRRHVSVVSAARQLIKAAQGTTVTPPTTPPTELTSKPPQSN